MATLIQKDQLENLAIENADIAAGAAIETSKLADGAEFVKRDGSVPFTGDQSMGSNKITNLGAPTAGTDAARLVDVQNAAAGLQGKEAVRVATTANITLSGTMSIDGVSVVAGNRVLVKNQTTAAQNGIYVAATGAWSRASDADTSDKLKSGTFVFVQEGTTNADSGWLLSTDGTITIGTTALTWVQFSGAGQIIAGAGLTKTGNQIDVNTASTARIVVNADNIDLALVSPGTTGNGLKIVADAYGRVTDRQNLTPADINAQAANALLSALAAISGNGHVVKNGASSLVVRTLAGSSGRVTVSNGDGVSGNPTVDLATSGVSAGTYNKVTVDVYGRVTGATNESILTPDKWVSRETPSGVVNGVNVTFTLANTPQTGSEQVYRNGVLQDTGSGGDYSISGNTITFGIAPKTGSRIRVSYFKS